MQYLIGLIILLCKVMYCQIWVTTYPEMGQDHAVNIMLQTGRPRKYGSMTGNLQGILITDDFSNHVFVESMICSEALAHWAVMRCDVTCWLWVCLDALAAWTVSWAATSLAEYNSPIFWEHDGHCPSYFQRARFLLASIIIPPPHS
jgi:hypothetical protein